MNDIFIYLTYFVVFKDIIGLIVELIAKYWLKIPFNFEKINQQQIQIKALQDHVWLLSVQIKDIKKTPIE